MGIQKFGTRLKPYAKQTVLGSTETPAKDAVAIIDGPGLAHYIYYQLCDDLSTGHISYTDIAEAVCFWLKTLESLGYRIEAILFDGALPAEKKDTRINRLQGYITKVQNFKQNLGSGLPVLSAAARRSLPPPPFLVFSVVEELLAANKAYQKLTYVVPGEADPYCVAAAQLLRTYSQDQITIFSDDADLLVYELDDRTCVAPFRDLQKSTNGSNTRWTADLYWPVDIALRGSRGGPLRMKPPRNLIEPAYFMALDPHLTLDQAFQKTIPRDAAAKESFAQFTKVYSTSNEVAEWAQLKTDRTKRRSLDSYDSRISELLLQCKDDANEPLRMYLPFLIDDPGRASAWNVGTDVRRLAYSLAIRAADLEASVQEYSRSGARLVSTPVEQQSMSEMDKQITELTDYLHKLMDWGTKEKTFLPKTIWRYIAMQQTLQYLDHEGHALPTLDETVGVITAQDERKWHVIHLSAQYQAAYYSLRILKQVLEHIMEETERRARIESAMLPKLWFHMAGLSDIVDAFSVPIAGKEYEMNAEQWREYMADLLSTFGVDEETEHKNKRRKKSKQKKKRRDSSGSGEEYLTTNPFALLADD